MFALKQNIESYLMTEYRDLDLKRTYTTLNTNIMKDIVDEILKTTVSYDRGVGFFSSSWLKEVAEGLSYFIVNGGKARILTSIHLSQDDWNAIKTSEDENKTIESLINYKVLETTEELKKALEEKTLAILSFLIKEGYLEFRFAIPCGNLSGGIFHSKTSIFTNKDGDTIVIAGSQNDSHQACLNEEIVNVFTSWGEGSLYAHDHILQYNDKWNGLPQNLKIYTIPETAKRDIIDVGSRYMPQLENIKKVVKKKLQSAKIKRLRDYQERAINAWFTSGCQGFYEMATGTGKTFTAISAINQLYRENGKICFMVLVPYKHLADQWIDELKENGYSPIPCFENRHDWFGKLNNQINQYKSKQINKLCIVALYATASNNDFQKIIKDQLGRIKWLLIADEAHNAGSPNYKKTLFNSASFRIGLSATPIRWYDAEGSSLIRDYFKKTVITYTLKEAINSHKLTPYEYYPILVELSATELEEYEKLSDWISRISIKDPKSKEDEDKLQSLLLRRADLVAKAQNKLPKLIELVKQHKREIEQSGKAYKHNLFYAAKGEYKKVLEALSSIGLKVHEFIGTVPNKERAKILESFTKGEIDGIVAIRCLDEGVDVPATQRAYIMSSTTNPKEFIQRRGRILRRSANKVRAYIYDFMVGPWTISNYSNRKTAVSLLNRELPRFAEFNDCSENKSRARQAISNICEYFGIIDELDIKPYDLYNRNKELQEENNIFDLFGENE